MGFACQLIFAFGNTLCLPHLYIVLCPNVCFICGLLCLWPITVKSIIIHNSLHRCIPFNAVSRSLNLKKIALARFLVCFVSCLQRS